LENKKPFGSSLLSISDPIGVTHGVPPEVTVANEN